MAVVRALVAASLLLSWGAGLSDAGVVEPPAIILSHAVRDSMNAVFARSNEHWDELADLNTMERMLGTVRPTQREYLGCLQGRADGENMRIDHWVPASDMKQLQLAVAGSCDTVPDLVGTFHTHPYYADLRNLPVKERRLSPQDLKTFAASRLAVTVVVWDQDSLDAAARDRDGRIVHPARIVVE